MFVALLLILYISTILYIYGAAMVHLFIFKSQKSELLNPSMLILVGMMSPRRLLHLSLFVSIGNFKRFWFLGPGFCIFSSFVQTIYYQSLKLSMRIWHR
jgi:hypothetical protein